MQQPLRAEVDREHKNRIAGRLKRYLDQLLTQQNAPLYQSRAAFSQQLAEIFTQLEPHLPHAPKLHILSLVPDLLDECLALKVYYDLNDETLSSELQFVSLNLPGTRLPLLPLFSNLHYAKGDLSEIESVQQLLREASAPPEGFDLILLNKPNITHPQLGGLFRKLLVEIIPWAAKEMGGVVITFDQKGELQAVVNYLNELGNPVYDMNRLVTVLHDNAQVVMVPCRGAGCDNEPPNRKSDSSQQRLSHMIQPLLVQPELRVLVQALEERDYGALLRHAVAAGKLEIVMELLSNQAELGFDINAISPTHQTALDVLAENRDRLNPHDAATLQSLLVRHGAKNNR